ncbi:MAG: ADP-ribosylglycohydrolase family protein, partial [Bacteroidetes bacterium]
MFRICLLATLGLLAFPLGAQHVLSLETLQDKIKGAWAAQTIGVTYGGPTEFRYRQRTIPDETEIIWNDTLLTYWMTWHPGLYDDIYMDLTFMQVLDDLGLDAPASAIGEAYARADYPLWHANQQGRYNILRGILPPESGHWRHNPHADDIDFQIEADFAGIMNPGLPLGAAMICDKVGHIMNYGDGYYGGVYVATLYSLAFVRDDVAGIVSEALRAIPPQSTFYQCIADVIRWHGAYPTDWRQTWRAVEEKWGEDLGCPDGAGRPFNIDAKLNAAYVVIGLLYGGGDLGRTLEISTRCGQDSDCNPATAGAILGTIMGYEALPAYWTQGLAEMEDLDFAHTTISLNDAYDMSFRHALEMIRMQGGIVGRRQVEIPQQQVLPVPLEQSFPGYRLAESRHLAERITAAGPTARAYA